MLRNYLTITYRNLKKSKLFSAINILGLALGIAACLLILQYVYFELSYDSFHSNADNIYRIESESYTENNFVQKDGKSVPDISSELKSSFLHIQEV